MSLIDSPSSEPSSSPSSPSSDSAAIPRNSPQFPSAENRLNDAAASAPTQAPATSEVEELSAQQFAAVDLLAMGKSPVAVARILEIDRKTVYNWRQNPSFKQAVEQRREELWRDAAARLRALVAPALDVIAEQLTFRYDRARFQAATTLLRFANFGKATKAERSK